MLATTLAFILLLLGGAQMQQQQTQGMCKWYSYYAKHSDHGIIHKLHFADN